MKIMLDKNKEWFARLIDKFEKEPKEITAMTDVELNEILEKVVRWGCYCPDEEECHGDCWPAIAEKLVKEIKRLRTQ